MKHQEGGYAELTEFEAPILKERLPRLRLAIRTCRVSFPSQIPIFSQQNCAESQWRIAALYFVQGWSFEQLAARYGVSAGRIRQAVRKWVQRAAALGYLQRIPPETPVQTAPVRIPGRPPRVALQPLVLTADAGTQLGSDGVANGFHKNP